MNAIFWLDGIAWWEVMGWTMLHYLWLGAIAGAAAMLCRMILWRASAEVRYVVAVVSLTVLAVLPAAIAGCLIIKLQVADRPWRTDESSVDARMAAEEAAPAESGIIELKTHEPILSELNSSLTSGSAGGFASTDVAGQNIVPARPQERRSRGLQVGFALLDSCAAYLPWLWLLGAPLTFVLLATGVVGAERLRRASCEINYGPIAEACGRLRKSLGVTRQVAVAACDRIAAPVLVGILRPIILLPPAAFIGWSPDEIEMVLLHELAHVRRWDNLINLMQRLVESILFFHPAVWLVSGWVRREREACCDELVVDRTHRPHAYAELLVALAAQMPRSVLFHPAASSAMAASPLRTRIRRILQLEDDPMLVSGKSLAVVVGGLFAVAAFAVLYMPISGQAEESGAVIADAAQADASAEVETKNKLRELVLALLTYHDSRGFFPAYASFDLNGKPLLSWRVHVLPFLGEAQLYNEFHLDEPWDSEHNRRLVARMPAVFKNPKVDGRGMTNFLAVVGKECVFDGSSKGIRIAQVSDGTSNTVALVEANADQTVEWTKPQDWKFDRRHPTAGLGGLWHGHWYGAKVDGSVMPIESDRPADAVGILFTRAGREIRSLSESEDRATQGIDEGIVAHEEMTMMGELAVDGEVAMDPAAVLAQPPSDPRVVATIPNPEVNQNWDVFIQAVDEARAKNLNVDAIFHGDTADLVVVPQPREADWPAMLGDPPRKERVIADKAWQRLGLKLVPASRLEQLEFAMRQRGGAVKIVGGNVPKGLPLPAFLRRIGNSDLDSFDSVLAWLGSDAGRSPGEVRVYAYADGHDYLFDVKPLGEERLALPSVSSSPPKVQKFPSLEDQKLADQAYKWLGLELEPIGDDDLNRVQALGYEAGVRVAGVDGNISTQQGQFFHGDILVALHVWPTKNLQDVAGVLNRDDLSELNPLKFYVVRPGGQTGAFGGRGTTEDDSVVTGRISVRFDTPRKEPLPNTFVPLDSRTPPSGGAAAMRSIDAQVERVLAQDPQMAALRHELMKMQTQRSQLDENSRGGRNRSSAPMDRQIARLKQQIDQYRDEVKQKIAKQQGDSQIPAEIDALADEVEKTQEELKQLLAAGGDEQSREAALLKQRLNELMPKWYERATKLGNESDESFHDFPKEIDRPYVDTLELRSQLQSVAPQDEAATTVAKPKETERLQIAAVDRANLRYDGKTFAEWRDLWRNELSTERRMEAVKALAAFGSVGYGKEAAEAILDVAKQYDWIIMGGPSPVSKLKNQAILAFAGGADVKSVPMDDWLPLLTADVRSGDKQMTMFAYWVFRQVKNSDEDFVPRLTELSRDAQLKDAQAGVLERLSQIHQETNDPRIAQRLTEALSEGPQAAWVALPALYPTGNSGTKWMGFGGGGRRVREEPVLEYRPELIDALKNSEGEQANVVIDVFRRLGPKAKPAVPKLLPLILELDKRAAANLVLTIPVITGSDEAVTDYLESVIDKAESPEKVERARIMLRGLERTRERESRGGFRGFRGGQGEFGRSMRGEEGGMMGEGGHMGMEGGEIGETDLFGTQDASVQTGEESSDLFGPATSENVDEEAVE